MIAIDVVHFSDEAEPPQKKKQKAIQQKAIPPATTGSPSTKNMQISIERVQASKQSKPKKKKKPARMQDPVQPKPPVRTTTAASSVSSLAVQFPRSQLRGCFGMPFTGEVQVLESGTALPPEQSGLHAGEFVSVAGGDVEFAIAPGVTEREVPQKGTVQL